MTTTRRIWLKSLVAMACAACVPASVPAIPRVIKRSEFYVPWSDGFISPNEARGIEKAIQNGGVQWPGDFELVKTESRRVDDKNWIVLNTYRLKGIK